MSSITITVPLDYFALTRASDMLHGMALDLENQGKQQARRGDDKPVSDRPGRADADAAFVDPYDNPDARTDHIEATIPASEGGTMPDEEKDAAAVFGSQPGKPATSAQTATAPGTAQPAETTPPPAATAEAPAPAQNATVPEAPSDSPNEPAEPAPAAASPGTASEATAPHGVELDSDGLPWDSRIHAGSKGKLAKTKQWKKKRGVDPELVEEVEAELRAAMSASPANPVEAKPTPAPAPAPAASEKPAPAPAPASGPAPAPAAATGAITSFPALMQRITAAGIAQADVTAAVNKQGLQALPLLAARPDLIPAVAAELFPGG